MDKRATLQKTSIHKKGKNHLTSHTSKKTACSSTSVDFSKLFLNDVEKLQAHAKRFRSQYQRITEVKEYVSKPENKCLLYRIDWSENIELFQTRQEKSVLFYCIM